jgi:hypothetical protein
VTGQESERAEFAPPLLASYLRIQESPEKALTLELIGSVVVAVPAVLHTIFMNQLYVIWDYQEELSRPACPHAEDI